jgi:hypothetical protein
MMGVRGRVLSSPQKSSSRGLKAKMRSPAFFAIIFRGVDPHNFVRVLNAEAVISFSGTR